MSPPSLVREKATRLAAMSWDEIRTRLKQEINKRRDALVWRAGVGSVSSEMKVSRRRTHDGQPPLSDLPLTSSAVSPPRFFFDQTLLQAILAVLRDRLPNQVETILQEAESICSHRFDLLGYTKLDFGRVIDWHLDPVSGKRAPRKLWYKIPFLNFDAVGDHKIIWELNRHQHLLVLAKAYLLSEERRYLRELVGQWQHWRRENPYPSGINWASSLEVAFRSLAWIWVSQFLRTPSAELAQFQADLQQALALNGRHLERYLSTYWSPNTHLLGEGVGLFFIGLLCPALQSASRWRELGWRTVLEQAERQVERDGTHFERSVYYHVYALDFFLHARLLAESNGITVPANFDQTIEKMMEVLCGLAEAGTLPHFGDDDGGRVFDPRRNGGQALLDPLSIGAVLFNRTDFKAISPGITEEALWLLGPGAAESFDALPPAHLPVNSQSFPSGGFYLMTSSEPWSSIQSMDGLALISRDEARRQMAIRAGPLGTGNCGHAHADALSVHISAASEEWLVDPGTYKYVSAGADRDAFRRTAAHSTLQVDGFSQADPCGPFAWRSLPKVQVEHWVRGEMFDLFEGSHSGYERFDRPVTHRRWIFHLKGSFWLVRDIAEGAGEHQLDISWHFASRLAPSYTPPGFTLATANPAVRSPYAGMFILPCDGHGWSQQVERGYVSSVYGAQEPAAVVRFSARAWLPVELAVVLDLVSETSGELGHLRAIPSHRAGAARGFQYERDDTVNFFLFAEGEADWQFGGWRSDARFIHAQVVRDRRTSTFGLCAGSYLEVAGERLIASRDHIERYELSFASGGQKVFSSDPDASVRCDFEALFESLKRGPSG
jgi:hypothetical protein